MSDVLLDVRELETRFFLRKGVLTAVDRVSFQLHENETLGIVGESGCGKSVTAMSLMRLVPDPGKITGGQVIYGGEDLLRKTEPEMRALRGRKISMIFQEPLVALNPAYTVGEQIAECFMIPEGLGKKESFDRAEVALRQVGITAASRRLYSYPHEFSGGMRQRVMIAMALSCDPKLIIADEPTTALDVTIQAQILEVMKALTREFGVALIVITHNLGVVARYADRVNIMYAGKIIERGSAREIYANPRHPYTVGLLKSVPRLDLPRRAKLDPIEGQPPDLINLPDGCAFRVRCPWAIDKCATDTPPLMEAGEAHWSACWRSEELGPAALSFLTDTAGVAEP